MDIIGFLPQFGNIFMTVLAFVVALSVIVAVHEFGHYIVARWSGIRAEVFSLGFGPVLLSRIDRRGTRWQLAALPFGGYVRFLGDGDAASAGPGEAAAGLSPERRRQTLQGAPLWARTVTVAAGPLFNFVLSVLVFAAVMATQGTVAEPLTVGRLKPLPVEGVTMAPGDRIEVIAGRAVPDFEGGGFGDFTDALPHREMLEYKVLRDGQRRTVRGPHPMPPLVSHVAPQSAAFDAGLQQGDVIVSVDGRDIVAFDQLRETVEGSDGQPLALQIWRDGRVIDTRLTPRRTDEPVPGGGFRTKWRIGIGGGLAFEPATERMGAFAALGGGVSQTGMVISSSLSGLFHMITGAISSCNMSGPIGIAEMSGAMASQGTASFIWFIAVLSTAVGLLNLFPVPVLDGGHLLFYAYEAATGRAPSETALRVATGIGLSLVLGLMAFAILNDIFCP